MKLNVSPHEKYKNILALIFLFAAFLPVFLAAFSSCAILKKIECPYQISDIQIISETCPKLCFIFSNESEKEIKNISLMFSLSFSSDSEYGDENYFSEDYFAEENQFYADFSVEIKPYAAEEFEIIIEDYLSFDEESEFECETLYATKILYKDSSVWKDEYGIFAK
mgnify:CR=1 FL=1